MNNLKTVISVIVIFIIGVSLLYWLYQTQITGEQELLTFPDSVDTIDPIEPVPGEEFDTIEEDDTVLPVNEFAPEIQPESGSNTLGISNIGVSIVSPETLSTISSPVTVSGIANTLGDISISIYDTPGNYLGDGSATACIGYNACIFEVTINFDTPESSTGTIRAESAEGSDVIQISF